LEVVATSPKKHRPWLFFQPFINSYHPPSDAEIFCLIGKKAKGNRFVDTFFKKSFEKNSNEICIIILGIRLGNYLKNF